MERLRAQNLAQTQSTPPYPGNRNQPRVGSQGGGGRQKTVEVTGVFTFAETNEVKNVSVMAGDSVVLHNDVHETQTYKNIEWRFENSRIARIKRTIMNDTQYEDERFRDRLNLDQQTGSLTIKNTRTTDSGLYQLTLTIGNKESFKTFNVTVEVAPTTTVPKTQASQPLDSVSVSPIVLISVSAAVSLLTVAAVGIFCICRRQRKTEQVQNHDEEITFADPTFYTRNAKSEMTEVVYTCFITDQ